MDGRALADAMIFSLIIGRALAVEQNLALSDAANFFDAGLTALGLLTALVTTIMRGRLDAENNTRDLLTYLAGKTRGCVTTLVGGANAALQQHSLSKALLLVEDRSVVWAGQLFSYYGAVSGKTVDLMPGQWLHPDHYPSQQVERCKCPQGLPPCKCLLLRRVAGVTEHLMAVAQGGVFKVDDEFDAIISQGCRFHKCHGFQNAVYHVLQPSGGIAGPLGPPTSSSPGQEALIRSITDLYALEEGNTGLVLLDPAEEPSVMWASTLLEASVTKDAEERGSENPFTSFYMKALEGEEAAETGREEWGKASWWLSRGAAFVIAAALVVLFRTDAFSSVLLARRTLRAYILDSTGTKLPLDAFCGVAQCDGIAGQRRAFVVLKPKPSGLLRLPLRALAAGAALEALVAVLWIAAVAATPWFRPVGSSYLSDVATWVIAVAAATALFGTFANAWWYVRYITIPNKRKWASLAIPCGTADATVVTLAILWMVRVARNHSIITVLRGFMLLGAFLQWMLGVQHLGAISSSFRGHSTVSIVPYSLTYIRLLALVAGGGSWA